MKVKLRASELTDESLVFRALDDDVSKRKCLEIHEDEQQKLANSCVNLRQEIEVHLNQERREHVGTSVLDDRSTELNFGLRKYLSVDEDRRVPVVGNAEAAKVEIEVGELRNGAQASWRDELSLKHVVLKSETVEALMYSESCLGRNKLDHPVAEHWSDANDFSRQDQ